MSFGVDIDVLWETTQQDVPHLKVLITRVMEEFVGNNEEFSKIPNLEEGLAAFEARDYTKAFELLKPIAEQEMLRRNV